jgi:DNA-binding beta-propeller fold protein YncE
MNRLRALLFVSFSLALSVATVDAQAETEIHSLTEVMEGHSVGGVTIDALGNVYVADFGEIVWKFTPEGQRREFAAGLYGTSGNAIDKAGTLLQSSFYDDSIMQIDRKGQARLFVGSGLHGPVGLAIAKSGEVFVANCRGNTISRISADGTAAPFAKSELFRCPNGVSFDREGNLYVLNFRDNRMFKIDPNGAVAPFAQISSKGLGHLCFKDDRFYVTAYESHEIYEVTLAGTVTRILGNGERGLVDGAGHKARLSFPNGIACHPWARKLYINEYVGESASALPRRAVVREIVLGAEK